MPSKKPAPERKGLSNPSSQGKPLDLQRVEDLLREGNELRRSVHQRSKELRTIGDSAMRFLVR